MESLAEALGRGLEALPAFGAFALRLLPPTFAAAALVFFLRRVKPVAAFGNVLRRLLELLLTASLLAMVLLSGLQIVLRNFFDSGYLWIDPLLRHLVLLLALTGAILATGAKRHIQINVLERLLAPRHRRVSGAVVSALGGTICLWLLHASLHLLRDEIEFRETLFLGVSSWMVVSLFTVTFAVLAFRFYLLLFLEIAGEAPHPEGEELVRDLAPGVKPDAEVRG